MLISVNGSKDNNKMIGIGCAMIFLFLSFIPLTYALDCIWYNPSTWLDCIEDDKNDFLTFMDEYYVRECNMIDKCQMCFNITKTNQIFCIEGNVDNVVVDVVPELFCDDDKCDIDYDIMDKKQRYYKTDMVKNKDLFVLTPNTKSIYVGCKNIFTEVDVQTYEVIGANNKTKEATKKETRSYCDPIFEDKIFYERAAYIKPTLSTYTLLYRYPEFAVWDGTKYVESFNNINGTDEFLSTTQTVNNRTLSGTEDKIIIYETVDTHNKNLADPLNWGEDKSAAGVTVRSIIKTYDPTIDSHVMVANVTSSSDIRAGCVVYDPWFNIEDGFSMEIAARKMNPGAATAYSFALCNESNPSEDGFGGSWCISDGGALSNNGFTWSTRGGAGDASAYGVNLGGAHSNLLEDGNYHILNLTYTGGSTDLWAMTIDNNVLFTNQGSNCGTTCNVRFQLCVGFRFADTGESRAENISILNGSAHSINFFPKSNWVSTKYNTSAMVQDITPNWNFTEPTGTSISCAARNGDNAWESLSNSVTNTFASLDAGVQFNCTFDTSSATITPFLEQLNFTPTFITTDPVITFVSQDPQDIQFLNVLNTGILNATFNISSSVGLDVTTPKTYHKVNNTIDDISYYINGTAFDGWFNKTMTKGGELTYWDTFSDNRVYPASYNIDEDIIETTLHNFSTLGNKEFLMVEIKNINPQKNFTFYELMVNTTTAAIGVVWYCNSSYTTGKIQLSDYCTLFDTLDPNKPYNHTHKPSTGGFSRHHIFPFPIINNKINGIGVSPDSYFIFGGLGWTYYYLNGQTRPGETTLLTNDGLGQTPLDITVDAHVHQFVPNGTYFRYIAEACNTDGDCENSSMISDELGAADIPPSSPNIIQPINGTWTDAFYINYSESQSILGQITIYNISLRDQNGNNPQSINVNNSLNTSYYWNSTDAADGTYRIGVIACDDQGLCSLGLGDEFTIDNVDEPPTYTNFIISNFEISNNTNITYTIDFQDDRGLSSWVFEINETGIFTNVSAAPMTGLTASVSFSKKIVYVGNICGRYYVNDTGSMWNQTDLLCFDSTVPAVIGYTPGQVGDTEWFNEDALDVTTTPGMFGYFFLLCILVFLTWLSFTSKVPFMYIFTALYGFFFSYLLFTSITAIGGIFMVMISISIGVVGIMEAVKG